MKDILYVLDGKDEIFNTIFDSLTNVTKLKAEIIKKYNLLFPSIIVKKNGLVGRYMFSFIIEAITKNDFNSLSEIKLDLNGVLSSSKNNRQLSTIEEKDLFNIGIIKSTNDNLKRNKYFIYKETNIDIIIEFFSKKVESEEFNKELFIIKKFLSRKIININEKELDLIKSLVKTIKN